MMYLYDVSGLHMFAYWDLHHLHDLSRFTGRDLGDQGLMHNISVQYAEA